MKPSGLQRGLLKVFLKVENFVYSIRIKLAIRAGRVPSVIPYTGYGSEHWVRVICRLVYLNPKKTKNIFKSVSGWRSFINLPAPKTVVKVIVDNQEFELISDDGGVVDGRLPLRLNPGWHEIRLVTANQAPQFSRIFIIGDDCEVGVVSDVDDTVMHTSLPQPLVAFWNTFVLDEYARSSIPGMAVLYDRLKQKYPGAPFIYLSNGAWNAAPTIHRFLSRNLYPEGPILLTDWGTTEDRWFRSGVTHKRSNLDHLARDFPNIRWVLIGDDGEHDVDRYAEVTKEFPERVAAVLIRQLHRQEVRWDDSKELAAASKSAPTVAAEPKSASEPTDKARSKGNNAAIDNKLSDKEELVTLHEAKQAQLIPWVFAGDGSAIAQHLSGLKLL